MKKSSEDQDIKPPPPNLKVHKPSRSKELSILKYNRSLLDEKSPLLEASPSENGLIEEYND